MSNSARRILPVAITRPLRGIELWLLDKQRLLSPQLALRRRRVAISAIAPAEIKPSARKAGPAESLPVCARTVDEIERRPRGAQGSQAGSITVAAIAENGNWVGRMASYIADPNVGPLLVGVYVHPDFRGNNVGLTDTLLSAIEAWARNHGGRLTLHVHEANAKAQRAYLKRGFQLTASQLNTLWTQAAVNLR